MIINRKICVINEINKLYCFIVDSGIAYVVIASGKYCHCCKDRKKNREVFSRLTQDSLF